MATWRPRVSVVIPVYNEERHIERCLGSVQAQSYPSELIEVLVADGGSSDRTRDIVAAIAERDPRVRLVHNPRRSQAAGLNVALRESTGQVIARLDGHAAWSARHIEVCIDLLERTGADNVGGTMSVVGESPLGEAFAVATRSRLGAGSATYRYGDREREVDTVWLGFFRRDALDRVGPFNERYPPHEDYELNHRLRVSGGRIVFSPEIPTAYWPRASWRGVASQYFRYGRGKLRVAKHHPGVLRPHHFAAPLLVAMLATGALGSLRSAQVRVTSSGLLAGYAATCLAVGMRASRGASAPVRVRVPAVFVVLHLAWGSGFWTGVVEAAPALWRRE